MLTDCCCFVASTFGVPRCYSQCGWFASSTSRLQNGRMILLLGGESFGEEALIDLGSDSKYDHS